MIVERLRPRVVANLGAKCDNHDFQTLPWMYFTCQIKSTQTLMRHQGYGQSRYFFPIDCASFKISTNPPVVRPHFLRIQEIGGERETWHLRIWLRLVLNCIGVVGFPSADPHDTCIVLKKASVRASLFESSNTSGQTHPPCCSNPNCPACGLTGYCL